jgi:hypothetical protein
MEPHESAWRQPVVAAVLLTLLVVAIVLAMRMGH